MGKRRGGERKDEAEKNKIDGRTNDKQEGEDTGD